MEAGPVCLARFALVQRPVVRPRPGEMSFEASCGRGEQSQAIGRSRGGRTTKIHAIADEQGRIAAILLTPGQASDISGARALLAAFQPPADLIADKAYDADDLRVFLIQQGTRPVISPIPNRLGLLDDTAFTTFIPRRRPTGQAWHTASILLPAGSSRKAA